jgi:hypothetical protein
MERTRWSDERLDERFAAIDQTFERIFDELRLIRQELVGLRSDLTQIGFGLVGVLIAAMTALIVALA